MSWAGPRGSVCERVGMPAKLKSQRKTPAACQSSAANQCTDPCCICLQKLNSNDETLLCSGSCQKYLHHYCASVSEQAFNADDTEPFVCFCCFKSEKEKQLQTLLSTVESLKGEIDVLKAAAHSKATSAADSNIECDGQPTLSPAHPRQAAPNVKVTPGQSRPASGRSYLHLNRYLVCCKTLTKCLT